MSKKASDRISKKKKKTNFRIIILLSRQTFSYFVTQPRAFLPRNT